MSDTISGGNQGGLRLKELIGASEAISVQELSIFLPNRDKNGIEIEDIDVWIDQALEVLSGIGGGASAQRGIIGVG
jgi:hypothetical protein